jgi:hypothetical protein
LIACPSPGTASATRCGAKRSRRGFRGCQALPRSPRRSAARRTCEAAQCDHRGCRSLPRSLLPARGGLRSRSGAGPVVRTMLCVFGGPQFVIEKRCVCPDPCLHIAHPHATPRLWRPLHRRLRRDLPLENLPPGPQHLPASLPKNEPQKSPWIRGGITPVWPMGVVSTVCPLQPLRESERLRDSHPDLQPRRIGLRFLGIG